MNLAAALSVVLASMRPRIFLLLLSDLQVDNPPLLLEALAPLSALRHLDLRGVFRKRPGSAAAPASLSLALTDKPHLSYLDLGQNRIYDLGAPAGLGAIYGTALMAPPWQLPVLQVCLLQQALVECTVCSGGGRVPVLSPSMLNVRTCGCNKLTLRDGVYCVCCAKYLV
jgi:hypothetical protein